MLVIAMGFYFIFDSFIPEIVAIVSNAINGYEVNVDGSDFIKMLIILLVAFAICLFFMYVIIRQEKKYNKKK